MAKNESLKKDKSSRYCLVLGISRYLDSIYFSAIMIAPCCWYSSKLSPQVSRALQRPPRKLQFCIQAKRKAFPEALHMMRKAKSILRPHRPPSFYAVSTQPSFAHCTVVLHKGLCGNEPSHEGQRKRPHLLLLFICNFTHRLIYTVRHTPYTIYYMNLKIHFQYC